MDGLYDDEGYRREKRSLEDKLANLVVPGVDAAMEAGNLLENLPVLWQEADLTERRKLLMAMLDAVYVDTVEEKSVVAIRPKPAFRPIFEVATTREGSGIALINQTPQTQDEPEGSESYSWWRRGRDQAQRPQNYPGEPTWARCLSKGGLVVGEEACCCVDGALDVILGVGRVQVGSGGP